MHKKNTQILSSEEHDLDQAATLLLAGQLVAFPTETVYGLGADARQGQAVAAVYEAKGRPSFNPLIAHLPSIDAAQRYVQWSAQAQTLADAFWPGPLTLVLPLRQDHGISPLVTAGLDTLAVRIPAHPTAHKLLALVDGPVAAPSANPSGRISPTTAAHVSAGLNGRIAAIVDDGACGVGLESTIVGLATPQPILLRPGGLAAEEIEAVLGHPLMQRDAHDALTAPGQLLSHYAPNEQVRLNATQAKAGELMLGFGAMACDLNLSEAGDLAEAAANLFGHLHQLDALNKPIAVAPVPTHGLGVAINDRLHRAAAPRD
ncbi:L-threonylcarbamoyladenylate synthase [Parasedimentitalea huanghaiensis]|uniref:Threonylcarbamoyl-AMP synthase n=1 Tax=Parasedimentitalea huanghaiensis TaxID=2682100 RepID=A0A6L6WHJ6_9RHOB|nr:L-threonylcarbamoyladenylate synthase [Zongyanglinia huanghaiensis]MVO15132.1 threonylcarbamoyl-AMP synthase [Zongyanglinia huanghaiensis]